MKTNARVLGVAKRLLLVNLATPLDEVQELIEEGRAYIDELRSRCNHSLANSMAIRVDRAEMIRDTRLRQLRDERAPS
jgi:pantothenate synthetase